MLLDLIGRAGGIVSEEQAYRQFLGRSMASVRESAQPTSSRSTLTDPQLDEMRAELMRRFRSELKPIPGIAEALARLGVPRCVASSEQPGAHPPVA